MDIEALYQIYLKCSGISIDSRKVNEGQIFFALKGVNVDGNAFAEQAIANGALCAVVDDEKLQEKEKCFYTPNVLASLQELALHHRKQLSIPIIAITGSNGKTTTKELIRNVLSSTYKTFATPGNFNNHIGLPISILQINQGHEMAVLEIGVNQPLELQFLCELLKPDYGLVTNIGKDHLEGFGSFEGAVAAYKEMGDYFRKENGNLFANADDEHILEIGYGLNVITYGKGDHKSHLDYAGSNAKSNFFTKVKVTKSMHAHGKLSQKTIHSQLFGSYHFYNIMAAVAVGNYFHVKGEKIINAIEVYQPAANRSQLLNWKNHRVILDAYNANPSSLAISIQDFKLLDTSPKVVILGDMLELGRFSRYEHEAAVEMVASGNFDHVVFVGPIYHQFKEKYEGKFKEVHFFIKLEEAKSWLNQQTFPPATFYIKGSRGIGLEQLVLDL